MQNNTPTTVPEVFTNRASEYRLASASVMKSSSRKNDDLIDVSIKNGKLVVLVADGATGFGYGHLAAKALADHLGTAFNPDFTSREIKSFLIEADAAVRSACAAEAEGADTTGIVFTLSDGKIEGASVGDSQAFVFNSSALELTASQRQRPRIGNGGYPQDFSATVSPGDILVAATDGLWNCVEPSEVERICFSSRSPEEMVSNLLARSKTSDGRYDDDVSIVCIVCT